MNYYLEINKCSNCDEMNSFEKGKVDFNVRDEQNNKL